MGGGEFFAENGRNASITRESVVGLCPAGGPEGGALGVQFSPSVEWSSTGDAIVIFVYRRFDISNRLCIRLIIL